MAKKIKQADLMGASQFPENKKNWYGYREQTKFQTIQSQKQKIDKEQDKKIAENSKINAAQETSLKVTSGKTSDGQIIIYQGGKPVVKFYEEHSSTEGLKELIDALSGKVETEIQERQDADNTEKTERETADQELSDKIDSAKDELEQSLRDEKTAREEKDNELEDKIGSVEQSLEDEKTARETKDQELDEKINDVSDKLDETVSALTEEFSEALLEEATAREEKDNELNGKITDLSGKTFAHAEYDKEEKTIKFYNSNGELLSDSTIDATDFIKDGMVESVSISEDGEKLIIVFNTDSGKETIEIPLNDLFKVYTAGTGISIDKDETTGEAIISVKNYDAINELLDVIYNDTY